jgi:hypothetical protein
LRIWLDHVVTSDEAAALYDEFRPPPNGAGDGASFSDGTSYEPRLYVLGRNENFTTDQAAISAIQEAAWKSGSTNPLTMTSGAGPAQPAWDADCYASKLIRPRFFGETNDPAPCYVFDGDAYAERTTEATYPWEAAATAHKVCGVTRFDTVSASAQCMVDDDNGSTEMSVTSETDMQWHINAGSDFDTGQTVAAAYFHKWCFTQSAGGAGVFYLNNDGSSSTATGTMGTGDWSNVTIGANNALAEFFTGQHAALVAYDSNSAATVPQIMAWFDHEFTTTSWPVAAP